MKVLFFVASLEGGGAERMMVNLANGFYDKGEIVEFMCGHFSGPYCEELNSKIPIYDLKKRNISKCFFLFRDAIKKSNPDYVLTTQPHAILLVLLSKLIFNLKFQVVVREATTPSESWKRKPKGVYNFLFLTLLKCVYRRAYRVVAVSRGVLLDVIEFYRVEPNKGTVVYNPIITDRVPRLLMDEITDSCFNGDHYKIITAGRMHRSKDFKTLIFAFSEVLKQIDARLYILGNYDFDPIMRDEVFSLVKELQLNNSIFFLGFKQNPFPYFRESDLFVLSSIYEGMPSVIVQAMYAGCAVVSTDCKSGPREILLDNEFGQLVPVGDPKRMAVAIIQSANSPVDKNKIISRAGYFSEQKAVEGYLSIFNRYEKEV